jgi:hypothetical protein
LRMQRLWPHPVYKNQGKYDNANNFCNAHSSYLNRLTKEHSANFRIKIDNSEFIPHYECIKLGLSLVKPPIKAYLRNLFCPLAKTEAGISLIINNLKKPLTGISTTSQILQGWLLWR